MRRRTFTLLVTLSYAVLFAPPLLAILAPGVLLLELTHTLTTFLALLNLAALGLVYIGTAFITVKRLQDMNKSGKGAILTLLPGGFLLLLWIATQPPVDNKRGGNRYGRNPRRWCVRGEQGARREFRAEHSNEETQSRGQARKRDEKHVGGGASPRRRTP